MNLKPRYIVLFSFMGLFALYLLSYYAVLIFKNDLPSANRQSVKITERGAILDRNGRFLALQIRFADVSVWRPSINDIDLLSNELAVILEMSPSEIREKISASESNFLFLKRQIDDAAARRLTSKLLPNQIFFFEKTN